MTFLGTVLGRDLRNVFEAQGETDSLEKPQPANKVRGMKRKVAKRLTDVVSHESLLQLR